MKRFLLNSLAIAAILAGLSACARDEPVTTTQTVRQRIIRSISRPDDST